MRVVQPVCRGEGGLRFRVLGLKLAITVSNIIETRRPVPGSSSGGGGGGGGGGDRSSSSSRRRNTAIVPVKTQLFFREGGLDFLFLKRTFSSKKTSRDLRVPWISESQFLSLKRQKIKNKFKK